MAEDTMIVDQAALENQPHSCYQKILKSNRPNWVCFSTDPEKTWNSFLASFTLIKAAGGIVFNPEHKALFILRHGKWDLPKGKMEGNERIEETAVREVEEECGITVQRLDQFAGCTWHTYERNRQLILKPSYWYYMYTEDRSEPKAQLEEGITEVKWLSKREIEERIGLMYPSIQEITETAILNHPIL